MIDMTVFFNDRSRLETPISLQFSHRLFNKLHGHCKTRMQQQFEIDKQERHMSNEGYHEPLEELTDETKDMHRAITSLMEELEAVDWYNQRVDACKDSELKAILAHNRDEEKEHAAMVLEWIRRKDPRFDKELKDYLFTDKPIAHE
jgi:ferritin-like protein